MNVTARRGSTAATFKLIQPESGLALARDIGKPRQQFHDVDVEFPVSRDNWSSTETWTLLGMFTGPGAYTEAERLVEDLVKPHSRGESLILDATGIPAITAEVEIGVPLERAVELDYQPGLKDRVDLRMTVPIVHDTVGVEG